MKTHRPNPTGLCLCGCGEPTKIMDQNDRSQGLIKGAHRGFIHGHHRRREGDFDGGPNPEGLCQCGCGEKTKRAARTDHLNTKGQHRRFISGHSKKGKVDLNAKARRAYSRNARKLNQFIEDVDRDVLYEMHGGMCGICKRFIDRDSLEAREYQEKNRHFFQIDHVIPLAKGGMHGYINTQPAHPRCNLKKWAHVS